MLNLFMDHFSSITLFSFKVTRMKYLSKKKEGEDERKEKVNATIHSMP